MRSPWSCNKVHIQGWRSFPAVPSTSGPYKSPGTSSAVGRGRALGCRSWSPCVWVNRSRMMKMWRKRRRRSHVVSGCWGPLGSTACQGRNNRHLMTVRGWGSEAGLESDSFARCVVADAGTQADGAGCWGHCYSVAWRPNVDESCYYKHSGSAFGQNSNPPAPGPRQGKAHGGFWRQRMGDSEEDLSLEREAQALLAIPGMSVIEKHREKTWNICADYWAILFCTVLFFLFVQELQGAVIFLLRPINHLLQKRLIVCLCHVAEGCTVLVAVLARCLCRSSLTVILTRTPW